MMLHARTGKHAVGADLDIDAMAEVLQLVGSVGHFQGSTPYKVLDLIGGLGQEGVALATLAGLAPRAWAWVWHNRHQPRIVIALVLNHY